MEMVQVELQKICEILYRELFLGKYAFPNNKIFLTSEEGKREGDRLYLSMKH